MGGEGETERERQIIFFEDSLFKELFKAHCNLHTHTHTIQEHSVFDFWLNKTIYSFKILGFTAII